MSSPFLPPIVQQQNPAPWASLSKYGSLGTGTFGLDDNYLNTGAAPSVAPLTGVAQPTFQMPTTTASLATSDAGGDGWLSMKGLLGGKNADGTMTQGWGMPALGLAQGLVSGFMGMKQYGLQKQALEEGKRQYEQNYAAQRSTTNTALEDRQRARVASNAGAYESVGSYMNRNGIK